MVPARNANILVAWNTKGMVQELQRLTAQGVLGLYRSFEVTEILGFQQGQPRSQPPTNILTLAVAEPTHAPEDIPERPFLNRQPIALRGTTWNIGVARYRLPLQGLADATTRFSQIGEWRAGRAALQVGTLAAVAPQFVPVNSHKEHPWNSVLKNNFWEGSHVLELFDTSKPYVQFLLDDSRLLTQLADAIRPYAPIGIDGMSDRLGNVIVQLPVSVIATGRRSSPEGDHTVTVAWHPEVQPRPIRVLAEIHEDSTVEAFDSAVVTSGAAPLKLHSPGGGGRTHIWDEQNRVLLAATPVESFVTTVALSMHAIIPGNESPERQFLLPHVGGQTALQSVTLKQQKRPHFIGGSPARPREPWQTNRLFDESQAVLQDRKEFVQYGKIAGAGTAEALADIHWLINHHGSAGVWLWDPFLNADDVLRTLFFCPHNAAELKALTSGAEPPGGSERSTKGGSKRAQNARGLRAWMLRVLPYWRSSKPPEPPELSWEQRQFARLEETKGNCEGLNLEFRIRKGAAGWSFHDRFIIFPRTEGPSMAWSLGTSVNSLGRQHHILQKVSNGELIANAFRDLWEKLDAPEFVVWKT